MHLLFKKMVSKSSQIANAMRNLALISPLFVLLASCTDSLENRVTPRERLAESVRKQSMLAMEHPPLIVVQNTGDIQAATTLISRLKISELARRRDTKFVDTDALPWLSGSAPGREFLSATGNRVLVRGHPQEFCPIALAGAAAAPETLAGVARTALERCLTRVPDGCGCRVIAMENALLATQDEVTYATGVTARIRARSLGLDGLLVAEERQDGTILLRDLTGIVGTVLTGPDGDATVRLKGSDTVYSGQVRDVGFRRGRLAQRIYAKNLAGEQVSLLIGFDPEELAEFAGAWLAWPPDA